MDTVVTDKNSAQSNLSLKEWISSNTLILKQ